MSIASEITRLTEAKTAIKDAIVAKGVEVADSVKIDGYAEKIAAIPTGEPDPDAPYRDGYAWNPPRSWPNMRRIYAEVNPSDYGITGNYPYRMAILFKALPIDIASSGWDYCIKSDGAAIKKTGQKWISEVISFDTSKDIVIDGEKYRWVLLISNTNDRLAPTSLTRRACVWSVGDMGTISEFSDSTIDAPNWVACETNRAYNADYQFWNKSQLKYIRGAASWNITGHLIFSGCRNIQHIERWDVKDAASRGEYKGVEITLSNNMQGAFTDVSALEELPKITIIGNPASVENCFDGCLNVIKADYIHMPDVTSGSGYFTNFYRLRALPRHLAINVSFSFANSQVVSDRDSVATFAADGTVDGGMIGNLNTCTASGKTVTLNSYIKALFTTDEQTAIADCLTSKNWGLVW